MHSAHPTGWGAPDEGVRAPARDLFDTTRADRNVLPIPLLPRIPTRSDSRRLRLSSGTLRVLSEPGTELEGRFVLEQELGRGGMGIVFRARDRQLDRRVAVKILVEAASEEDLNRFRREAQTSAQLRHPNVVLLLHAELDTYPRFLVMEYVDGESLRTRVRREGPLEPLEAARLVEGVARALAFAHERGVLHRDVKPGNVLVGRDGEPLLADFGLAKRHQVGIDPRGTLQGDVMGTPAYMSPEQAAGAHDRLGTPSDLFSLGATLYYLLTGRNPFARATLIDTLRAVMEETPILPSLLCPAIDPELERICLRCLQKDPGRRFASARDLAEVLSRYRAGPPPAPARDEQPSSRRGRLGGLAAALCAGGLLVGVASAAWRSEPPPAPQVDGTTGWSLSLLEVAGRGASEPVVAARNHARVYDALRAAGIPAEDERAKRALSGTREHFRRAEALAAKLLFEPVEEEPETVAFSPDSRTLVVATHRGTLQLRSLPGFELRRELREPREGSLFRCAFSGNQRLSAVSWQDQSILSCDLETGEWGPAVELGLERGYLATAEFSADGRRLAVMDRGARFSIWELEGRRWQHLCSLDPGFERWPTSYALSHDGSQLMIAGEEPEGFSVYELAGQGARRIYGRKQTGTIEEAVFGARGLLLTVRERDWQAVFWRDGAKEGELPTGLVSTDEVELCALSPDERLLALGLEDGSLAVYSWPEGRLVGSFREHVGEVERCAFSPDGRWLVTADEEHSVVVWDVARLRSPDPLVGLEDRALAGLDAALERVGK